MYRMNKHYLKGGDILTTLFIFHFDLISIYIIILFIYNILLVKTMLNRSHW